MTELAKAVINSKPHRHETLQLDDELMQADTLHALGENAAAVFHELRNPLAAIRAHVQVLERKVCRRESVHQESFSQIYQGIEQMNRLLDQFLQLSRLASAELRRQDVVAVVQDLLPLMQSMAVMRGITLREDIRLASAPCLLDEQQIKRLLFNLFANACDACQRSERPQVAIELVRDKMQVLISVSDNGCGIAKERLKQIWQPFFTSKPAGTGLGLPACAAIAQEHEGSLTVISEEGVGSRFVLCLHIAQE